MAAHVMRTYHSVIRDVSDNIQDREPQRIECASREMIFDVDRTIARDAATFSKQWWTLADRHMMQDVEKNDAVERTIGKWQVYTIVTKVSMSRPGRKRFSVSTDTTRSNGKRVLMV